MLEQDGGDLRTSPPDLIVSTVHVAAVRLRLLDANTNDMRAKIIADANLTEKELSLLAILSSTSMS